MPDIEKLKKENPEKFDYSNITDLDEDKRYVAEMDKFMPQGLKDLVKKEAT